MKNKPCNPAESYIRVFMGYCDRYGTCEKCLAIEPCRAFGKGSPNNWTEEDVLHFAEKKGK